LQQLGFHFRIGDLGAGVLAAGLGLASGAVITSLVLSIAKNVTHRTVTTPQQLPDINRNPQWVLAFFAVVIVAPIAEELFFRGFMYQALRRWRGVLQGVLLSALVFALAHVSLIIMPSIFVLGVILAYLFERRGSLAATIAAHMSYNLIGFIAIVATSRR
jgi:membrane protease YdiL (CAAX protease family)